MLAAENRAPIRGRARELAVITQRLDDVIRAGSALVLRGDAGIGKSRLLSEAVDLAERRQMTVLTTSGVQSEAELAFGGLQQLLRPLRPQIRGLPEAHRTVLDAALGIGNDRAPERFRIALAVLDLLSDAASEHPLLIVAEDAHWLDRPSVEVLRFVARRLESDPIVVLAAVRDGYRTPLTAGELPELELLPLDPESAAELLDDSGEEPAAAERSRILHVAAGNPLALVELPRIADRLADEELLPGLVPLTERMERAFAARAGDLPALTRQLLLIAALNDSESLSEVLHAGALLTGEPVGVDALQPAADAAIAELDERTVRLRHPLMRSAIRASTGVQQRRAVHAALSETLRSDPDRRVWHRAALISGPHEEIAIELEEVGRRARRRGALQVAMTALRRAAELSEPARRVQRLLSAGELAVELGQPELAAPLLRMVGERSGPLERALATLLEEMVDPRDLGDGHRLAQVLDTAEQAGRAGDRELHISLLWLAVHRAWRNDPGPAARRILVQAARRLGGAEDPDPRVVAIYAYADPVGHVAEVLPRLQALAAQRTLDTESARHLGPAAFALGAFDLAAGLLGSAAEGARAEGRLAHLPRMLVLHGIAAALRGDWDVAVPAGEEARRLATELGEPFWIAGAETVLSIVAGMRGDPLEAERGAARAEQLGRAGGSRVTAALAQFGRVQSALGESRYDDALSSARRLFDPADPACHPGVGRWLIGELAEAAVHVEDATEARALLAQMESTARGSPAAWIELNLLCARAVLARDQVQAQQHFDAALGSDLLKMWPLQRARLQLAYGEWLRRRRRIADSRAALRAARDTFDRLGCDAWSERARRELRASGERSRHRGPAARDQLTAQELQIAQLAADGLSNREIGQQLYLSHRTISTHLYRIYPKLGIGTRGELRRALSIPAE